MPEHPHREIEAGPPQRPAGRTHHQPSLDGRPGRRQKNRRSAGSSKVNGSAYCRRERLVIFNLVTRCHTLTAAPSRQPRRESPATWTFDLARRNPTDESVGVQADASPHSRVGGETRARVQGLGTVSRAVTDPVPTFNDRTPETVDLCFGTTKFEVAGLAEKTKRCGRVPVLRSYEPPRLIRRPSAKESSRTSLTVARTRLED
jgi:hypothetical protein